MKNASQTNNVFDRMMTLSRAMDDALGASASGRGARPQLWLPVVDCYETENAFVIAADLPGVESDQVDISFEQNTLTIAGTRNATVQAPEKGELRLHLAERVSGQFARSIRLPEYVDAEKIDADYANGVLTVTVPKAAAAKPRKIAVNQRRIES